MSAVAGRRARAGGETPVLRSKELPPGGLREVRIGSRRVLLARLRSGEVVAAEALCPHEGTPLAEGTIRGEAVDCPTHHYLFDLRTGQNLYPYPIYPEWKRKEVGDLSLAIYPCRENGGWIRVSLGPERRSTASPGDSPGALDAGTR